MTTYPLNKPSYILFQESASKMSYSCDITMNNNMNKLANFNFGGSSHTNSFYLILTRGPITIVN